MARGGGETKATTEEGDGGKGLRTQDDLRGFRRHASGLREQMGARDYTSSLPLQFHRSESLHTLKTVATNGRRLMRGSQAYSTDAEAILRVCGQEHYE